MGQHSKIISLIVVVSLIAGCIPSFGQTIASSKDDTQLGVVLFKNKNAKLTRGAKAALDTMINQIQSSPTMQVRAVSSSKDLCDKCSKRSWKRIEVILRYLSKRGVPEERLIFTNRLEGESNKVYIFLTTSVGDSPHPNIKKQK